MDPITAISTLINTIIGRIAPDKTAELNAEQDNIKIAAAAIIAEANSQDKWTSRARPSFMYVMYIMILMSLPISLVSVISPSTAHQIAQGLNDWLGAIPEAMWQLFGVGYVGYVAGRSWDKTQIIKGK